MRRLFGYAGVSLVAFILSQVGLAVAYGLFGWPVLASVLFSLVVSAIPAYALNRLLVWPDRGADRAGVGEGGWFLLVALCGSLLTAGLVTVAEHIASSSTRDRATLTAVVNVTAVVATGLMWLLRYLVLNLTIFRHRRMNSGHMLHGACQPCETGP